MVELAFPILVIKTFNNWLLKFIGNLVSVLSVVVPHCRYINLQWGYYWYAANNGEEAIEVTLPVSFNQKAFISQITNYDYTILEEPHGLVISSDVHINDLNKFKFYDLAPKGVNNSNGIFYFIIGK